MHNIQHLNRRSFLCAAGTIAAATIAGPATAQERGSATAKLVNGRRKLGKLEVSSIGLGCQDMTGAVYASVPNRADMIALARAAHDRGVTFFDAAEAYGPLEVERILGEALAPFRNQVVIATKFGWNIDPETGRMAGGLNSRPEHLRTAVDGMLKRLRTDRIDLLYQHRVDPAVPIEDVAGTVKDLIDQGKVLHFGLCEPGPQTVRRAHAVQPLAAIQNEYSIMARDPEAQILPICKELGIGLVCWGPLAQGFLTGVFNRDTQFQRGDFRGSVPWFSPENRPGNLAIVEFVKDWALRKKATPAQISLAWLLAQGPSVVPIPGTNRLPHLIEDLGTDAVRFTPEELRDFNAALTRTPVQGARMGRGILSLSGVEAPPKAIVAWKGAHMRTFVAIAIACCALASGARSQVIITRNNSRPSSTGSADNFTGTVRILGSFQGTAPARVSGATVTFEPGARTVWHVHPLGQTLIITAGTGRVQRWGDPVDEVRQGDVVWIPPGQKHWHGAAPNSSMTHIAITEQLDGKTVEWMEKVSDAQYSAPPRGQAADAGPRPRPSQGAIGDFAPKLAQITDDVLYGDIWERPELSKRDRSLATVAALIAMNRPDQLRSHLRIARENGLTQEELIEVITHLAFYAGWPNAVSAIGVAKEVFGQK